MLLVTAKLNYNNTEFLVVGGGGGSIYPYCSLTNFYLVMVELGFDNIFNFLMSAPTLIGRGGTQKSWDNVPTSPIFFLKASLTVLLCSLGEIANNAELCHFC